MILFTLYATQDHGSLTFQLPELHHLVYDGPQHANYRKYTQLAHTVKPFHNRKEKKTCLWEWLNWGSTSLRKSEKEAVSLGTTPYWLLGRGEWASGTTLSFPPANNATVAIALQDERNTHIHSPKGIQPAPRYVGAGWRDGHVKLGLTGANDTSQRQERQHGVDW